MGRGGDLSLLRFPPRFDEVGEADRKFIEEAVAHPIRTVATAAKVGRNTIRKVLLGYRFDAPRLIELQLS
jgi:hypothetical protein